MSSDDDRRSGPWRTQARRICSGIKAFIYAILGAALYLSLFLATSVAPVLFGVPERLGVPLGLSLALITLSVLLSSGLRAEHPTNWSSLSAADALSIIVAVGLTGATVHDQVGGGGNIDNVVLTAIAVLFITVFFVATVPRLEGLLNNLTSVDWPSRGGVTFPQALAGYFMIGFFKPIARSTNAIALMIALLGYAFAFDDAPAWTSGALMLVLLIFLRVYEGNRIRMTAGRRKVVGHDPAGETCVTEPTKPTEAQRSTVSHALRPVHLGLSTDEPQGP